MLPSTKSELLMIIFELRQLFISCCKVGLTIRSSLFVVPGIICVLVSVHWPAFMLVPLPSLCSTIAQLYIRSYGLARCFCTCDLSPILCPR